MIKKQRGMTLIELMVSMMLGLGLVAGVSQLFIQSQKSFTLQRNLSDMMDDGTFVLEDLAKGLGLAGYSEDGSAVSGYIGTNSTDNELYYSFKLGNLSQLNNSICIANSFAIGDLVTVRIYNSTANVLTCVSKSASQPLISDVQKLVFKYGVKTLNLACAAPATPTIPDYCFYYAKAADVTDWTKVFAVKVFVVLRSVDKNLTKNKTGWKIDGGAMEYPTTDEKRLYKVFSKTIYLRAGDKS